MRPARSVRENAGVDASARLERARLGTVIERDRERDDRVLDDVFVWEPVDAQLRLRLLQGRLRLFPIAAGRADAGRWPPRTSAGLRSVIVWMR